MKYVVGFGFFTALLFMGSGQADNTNLASLQWMVGEWRGKLGERTVEEAWSAPNGGHMSAMVRLSNAAGIDMVELIAIEENDGGLMLYLRQFSPALEPRLSQDMPLEALAESSVSFTANADAVIKRLVYTLIEQETMRIDVTVADGKVLSAYLKRR